MLHLPFLNLARQFRAIFFDSYGVLRDSGGIIEGGVETLSALRDEGVLMRVLTNDASRSRGQQAEKFRSLGYDLRPDEIITSGMMARQFLQDKVAGGRVAYLGTPAAARYITDAGCEAVAIIDVGDYTKVDAVAFLDDEGFDWAQALNITVNLLRVRSVPVLVANTDKLYPTRYGRVAVATGGLAKMIEEVVGRRFLHFGKPDTQMYHHAFEDLNLNDSLAKRDILMVGDTLGTDILGGNKFGIRTCLVLSGNTSALEYQAEIQRVGIVPDFVVESIG